ncbi:MAG: hypothetical protein JO112_18535, partial [Planctomycetes bacterium]|nr:hypothetical protein [Planctomycetota bacterium]
MSMGAVSKPLSWSGKRWLVLGLVLLCILLSIQYTLKTSGAPDRSAFNRWLRQLRVMGQEDIWHDFNYPNPPIMALFLKGLAALP